jgi:GNAT superfamily N-acetyltransferase
MESEASASEPVEVVIAPILAQEAEETARQMPWRQPARHVERAASQRARRAVYLIAWSDGVPVGHSFVKSPGDLSSRQARLERCVEIEDLFVRREYRTRGIGAALLEASEQVAREAGHDKIGLAVALENDVARRLYARHGYRDAGHGVFTLRWTSVDERGVERTWREQCTYLTKPLHADLR